MPLIVPRDSTVAQLRDTALACYLGWRDDHLVSNPATQQRAAAAAPAKRGPKPRVKATAMGVLLNAAAGVVSGGSAAVVATLRQLTAETLQLGRKECWKGACVRVLVVLLTR